MATSDIIDDLLNAPATLKHYGVKGMKWGVRRDRSKKASSGPRPPEPVKLTQRPGEKVKATGGKYGKASDDAVRAARLKQKASKSTTDSLSNDELRDLVNRMNLERQYSQLNPKQKSLGEKFITGYLDKEMDALKRGKAGPTESVINGVETVLKKTRGS